MSGQGVPGRDVKPQRGSTMSIITFNDMLMVAIAIICITSVATLRFIMNNYDVTDEEIKKDVYRNLRGNR